MRELSRADGGIAQSFLIRCALFFLLYFGSVSSARFRRIKCRKYGLLTPVSMRNIVFSGVTPRDVPQIYVRGYMNVCVQYAMFSPSRA